MRLKLLAAATILAAPMLTMSKPLTVCTESSPDGFDVVQFNSLVTTNASADVIFNTIVSYDEAAKKVAPSLAQKWDVSSDGLTYTFHLCPDVQFQTTDYFKPTRPARCRRRRVHLLAHARRQQSVAQSRRRERLSARAIDGPRETHQGRHESR